MLAAPSILFALIACAEPRLEPFRYGDIGVRVPQGWKTSVHYAPGSRLLVAREKPDEPYKTPELLLLEVKSLVDIGPKEFAEAFLAHFSVDYRVEDEKSTASTYEVLLEGRTPKEPIRASLLSYSSGDKLYLYAFSALPEEFHELGGAGLRTKAFATQAVTDELIKMDAQRTDPAKVWAEANGYQLTEKMIADALAFGEFLAAHAFTLNERNELRRKTISLFGSTTADDYDAYQQMGRVVDALPDITAMQRATLRRDLMRNIYFELQKAEEDSPLMTVVYRYNPILGADKELGLVATKAGSLSLLASNLFVLEHAGLDPPSSEQMDEFVEELRDAYDELGEKDKQYLSDAEINWVKLIVMWQSWDANKRKERMKWAGVYRIDESSQVARVARDLEHLAGFDMTSEQVQQMLELSLAMSNLQYMRMMISSYTDF